MFLTLSTLTIQNIPKCFTNSGEILKHSFYLLLKKEQAISRMRHILNDTDKQRQWMLLVLYWGDKYFNSINNPTVLLSHLTYHPCSCCPIYNVFTYCLLLYQVEKWLQQLQQTITGWSSLLFSLSATVGSLWSVCWRLQEEGMGVQKYSFHCCSCCVCND